MSRFSLPTNVFLAPQQVARPAPAPRLATDTKYATLGRPRTSSGHQPKGGVVSDKRASACRESFHAGLNWIRWF